LGPTANIGGGRSAFGVCGKLVSLHLLLLLDVPLWIAVLYLQSVASERRTRSPSSAFQAFMAGLKSATVVSLQSYPFLEYHRVGIFCRDCVYLVTRGVAMAQTTPSVSALVLTYQLGTQQATIPVDSSHRRVR